MAKIAMIMPNNSMVKMAQQSIAETGANAAVFFSDSSHVLDTLAQAQRDGALVAVARGNMASILQHEATIPLVVIQISGQELLTTIHEAHSMLDHPGDLIALTGFPGMYTDPEPIASILNANVRVYTAKNVDDMDQVVSRAVSDGAKLVVGTDIALEQATRLGVKTLYLHSTKPSIDSALNSAMRVLFGIETAQRRTAEMMSLLNSTFDAILKLDREGNIIFANFMAERVFHTLQSQLVGKNIFDLIETNRDSPFTRAVLEQRNTYSSVVRVGQEEHVASLNVLRNGDSFEGFMLALQGFRRLDDMQNKIRQDRSSSTSQYKARHELSEYQYPSECMQHLRRDAAIVAQYDLPVVILGAPGTRRVRLAESIHNASSRAQKPFVALDLSAMSPEMQVAQMQIPLDTSYSRQNAFQIAADFGTVLLEHFDCLCEEAQPLFKHILTKGYILRSDGVPYYRCDCRVICTVDAMPGKGSWRMPPLPFDFSYFDLYVPSLSERPEDMPILLDEYLEEFSVKYKKYVHVPPAIKALAFTRSWERDEKEFRGFVEKLVLLSDYYEADEKLIQRLVLHSEDQEQEQPPSAVVVNSSEEADLINALKKYRGNRSDIAEALGISKTTLWRKLKKYNLQDKRY